MPEILNGPLSSFMQLNEKIHLKNTSRFFNRAIKITDQEWVNISHIEVLDEFLETVNRILSAKKDNCNEKTKKFFLRQKRMSACLLISFLSFAVSNILNFTIEIKDRKEQLVLILFSASAMLSSIGSAYSICRAEGPCGREFLEPTEVERVTRSYQYNLTNSKSIFFQLARAASILSEHFKFDPSLFPEIKDYTYSTKSWFLQLAEKAKALRLGYLHSDDKNKESSVSVVASR